MHWQDLRSRPVESILALPGVTLSTDQNSYQIGFLNSNYRIDPIEENVIEISPDPDRTLSQAFQILLIRYLLASPLSADGITDEEISESELPGGVTFFQGPHSLPVHLIADRYKNDVDAFLTRGRQLGADIREHGDGSIRLWPFLKIPVTFILWKQDEEFPASVSVLFDRSIGSWFELDMVFTLVWQLVERLLGDETLANENI
jgi:hypothetical protein